MEEARILVVDDDPLTLKLLAKALSLAGYEVIKAESGAQALEALTSQVFDAAVVDLRMPGMGGLDLLRELKRHDPSIEVVMTTAYPEVSTAVEALKHGAYDYLQKPLNLDELRERMARAVEHRFLRGEVRTLRSRLGERLTVKELVGVSPPMMRLRETIGQVAGSDSPILIEGESGTGKELVAAGVHRLSARSREPFIPVNCGAIPQDLMESEFFGHVRGAFSGAVSDTLGLFRSAHRGTLFLDEVAELPVTLQAKLLREKEVRPVGSTKSHAVDARIIAATNRNLEEAVRSGGVRQDLYYRLNVVRLVIPSLRDRKADIPVLVTHFLRQLNERFGRDVRAATPEAVSVLQAYDFPGNVRELENLLERAYALGASREITPGDLPALTSRPEAAPATAEADRIPTLAETERELIVRALRRFGNDREQAGPRPFVPHDVPPAQGVRHPIGLVTSPPFWRSRELTPPFWQPAGPRARRRGANPRLISPPRMARSLLPLQGMKPTIRRTSEAWVLVADAEERSARALAGRFHRLGFCAYPTTRGKEACGWRARVGSLSP